MFRSMLKLFWEEPSTLGLDMDSAEAVRAQRALIMGKPFLRRLYESYYKDFEKVDRRSPVSGIRLEIGSGGGFLCDKISELIRLDVRYGAHVNLMASALELPFAGASVGAIFMLNVLHHLKDPERFFKEAVRVLKPGGRVVMIEPFVSPVSRVIYTWLHHEPFDPDQEGWKLVGDGAMLTANDALPWIIFERDRHVFEGLFKNLEIVRVEPHTVLMYLASGGLSYRAMLPEWAFTPLSFAESYLGSLRRQLSSMMTIELVKLPLNNP